MFTSNTTRSETNPSTTAHVSRRVKRRVSAYGTSPTALADIYDDDVNIAVWQRELPEALARAVDGIMTSNRAIETSMTVSPESAADGLAESLRDDALMPIVNDAAKLVDMFCCLFDIPRVGLRLVTLDTTMCPRFHVDRVPARLITTYSGVATEWVPHEHVDRTKLGPLSGGRPDAETGLYGSSENIQSLACGEVALLKGESWEGNEDAGLVHRSPAVPINTRRLLLTLDFSR